MSWNHWKKEFVRCSVRPVNDRKQMLNYTTDRDDGSYGILLGADL